MHAIVFTDTGGNEVVRLEQRPDPVPSRRELLVRVRYAGLNPADVMQRDGHYPPPPGAPADVPGLEVAGEVEGCGPGVRDYRPGARVFGIVAGGGLADHVVVDERTVLPIPESLDDRSAAAVPEVYVTAHDALVSQGRLATGETLLVHGASGAVGTAAVQIGLLRGARVLGVARSEQGRAAVAALGAEPVADAGFLDEVRRLTAGRGADVVLELVGAPHFPANLEALALHGRILVVGIGAGATAELPLRALMSKRASLRGTVLRPRSLREKRAALLAFARDVLPALADGRIRPMLDAVYPAERVTEAFDRLGRRGRVGKVLLDFGVSAATVGS